MYALWGLVSTAEGCGNYEESKKVWIKASLLGTTDKPFQSLESAEGSWLLQHPKSAAF